MNKLLLLFALYACGASETPVPQGSSTAKSKPRETQSAETTAPAARVQPERNTGGRVLVVYFSRTGENYNVGTINEGNTAIVGGMIAACIGADVFEMLALFAAHHVGNRKWYCTLPKGKYTASRVFRTAFDALLLILMVVQPMSVHAGTHLFALCVDLWKKKPRIAVFAVTAALSAYGVYAFVKRGFPGYLFLKTAFAFFDYGEPRMRFFLDYLAIMILFMTIGCMVSYGLGRISAKRKAVKP